MDIVIATAVAVLLILTVTEGVSFFRKIPDDTGYAVVIPVFPEDTELLQRLEYHRDTLCGGVTVILVDYGASVWQKEVCRNFCDGNGNAVITDPAGVEKILSKTFAINPKI